MQLKYAISRSFSIPAVALIFFLVGWYGVCKLFAIDKLILPLPTDVFLALMNDFTSLLKHGGITLMEAILGFLVGGGAGFILGSLFYFFTFIRQALYPYAIALKAVPLIALAPLIVVWCGTGLLSKVVLAAIISFFPILVNTVQGLASVETEALDLMATLSASRWQIFKKLSLPHALPSIFAGMKISCTFAVVGAVVAEFIGATEGIGYVIKSTSYYFDTDAMFAGIFIAALTGLIFFSIISILQDKIVFWHKENNMHEMFRRGGAD